MDWDESIVELILEDLSSKSPTFFSSSSLVVFLSDIVDLGLFEYSLFVPLTSPDLDGLDIIF